MFWKASRIVVHQNKSYYGMIVYNNQVTLHLFPPLCSVIHVSLYMVQFANQ